MVNRSITSALVGAALVAAGGVAFAAEPAATEPTAQERLADGLAALPRARRAALADAFDAWLEAAGLVDVTAAMVFDGRTETPARSSTARRAHRAERSA